MAKKKVNEKSLKVMMGAVSKPDDDFYGLMGEDNSQDLSNDLFDAQRAVVGQTERLRELQAAENPDKEAIRQTKKDLLNARKAEDKAIKALQKAVAKARLLLDETVAAFAKLEAAVASGDYEVVDG
jgi:hypothetical protein